ncbi:MAG TPA: alanine racemase, partial [Thermoanaerobaculia bacterium]|nr:alanine racemase [Thermoanaerobaculia bacterium]
KSGVDPAALFDLADAIVSLRQLHLTGLMAIPPVAAEAETRQYFRRMRELRDEVQRRHSAVRHLSIGMTDDFELAIEEGATMIRVGRAIFEGRT